MQTLSNLESFVLSAQTGSFSAAARKLGLSPAAVSKSVARLEAGIGVLLFQRSTHKLTLTEAGELFLQEVSFGLGSIQQAVAHIGELQGQPAGTLKMSVPIGFGFEHLLPLIAEFCQRYPKVIPDIRFENRQVDLITEGLDVAIGGAIDIPPGVVARELTRVHVVAVASPQYLSVQGEPKTAAELQQHRGIGIRSTQKGRIRSWTLKNKQGELMQLDVPASVVVNDPEAVCRLAAMGSGVAVVSLTQANRYLKDGRLVRILPDWFADLGPVALYFSGQRLLPAKTRAFIDFMVEKSRALNFATEFHLSSLKAHS